MQLKLKIGLSFLIIISIAGIFACEDYHGNIFGRVTQTRSRNGMIIPVEDALVTAKNLKDHETVSTYTDFRGYYRLLDAGFGLNKINVEKDGYYESSTMLDIRRNENHQLDFRLKKISDKNYTGLTVVVLDRVLEAERPIKDARVDLYRGFGTVFSYMDTKTTNEDGIAIFSYPEDKVQDNLDFNTNISLRERNYPIGVDQDTILLYRLEVSAIGYRNATRDFTVTYDDPIPKIVIVEMAPV